VVNDVSGGLADPGMAAVVADSGVPYVAMHWRAHSTHMQSRASYDDVVQDVCRELTGRVEDLCARGVRREQIVLDPGFGFAKLAEHSWRLLAHLDRVQALGFPVLVGTSRKSFLGRLGVPEGAPPRPAAERDAATAATTVIAALAGAWGVRVHHVPSSLDALRVVAAMEAAR
jgi:dihydropteroate synthase